jgi:hypothetical protein
MNGSPQPQRSSQNTRVKQFAWWLLALLLTLLSAVYQRISGPSYPVRGSFTLNGETLQYRLPRSHPGETDAQISLPVSSFPVNGSLLYRRFKVAEPMKEIPLRQENGRLSGFLPHQPPAGKLEYFLRINTPRETFHLPPDRTVVIRFRGDVAGWILVPHILIIFLGMLFSTRSGLAALLGESSLRSLAWCSLLFTMIGGLLLGPPVQFQAFGAYWTGIPFGHDLTDNKTLIAVILWLTACIALGRQGPVSRTAKSLALAAAALTFVVFLIPHSMLGSELDYSKVDKGVKITGH